MRVSIPSDLRRSFYGIHNPILMEVVWIIPFRSEPDNFEP